MRGYLLNSPENVHRLRGVHDSWTDIGGEEQCRKMTNDRVKWKERIVLAMTTSRICLSDKISTKVKTCQHVCLQILTHSLITIL